MAEFCNSVSALPLLGHLILKQISAKKVQSRFFNFGSEISKKFYLEIVFSFNVSGFSNFDGKFKSK